MPSFENKRLASIRRDLYPQRLKARSANEHPAWQAIQGGHNQQVAIQHYEHYEQEEYEESDSVYLRTQQRSPREGTREHASTVED
jgi:hypothetical protein